MPHTRRNPQKLIARVRRIKGQIEGVERALAAQAPCAQVLQERLQEHVIDAPDEAERRAGGQALSEVMQSSMK